MISFMKKASQNLGKDKMHEIRFCHSYIVFIMIVFQCLIEPCQFHLQHRNICRENCVTGLSCTLRLLTQRCVQLNLNRQTLHGMRNPPSPILDDQFIYQQDWEQNRRPVPNNEIFVPTQSSTKLDLQPGERQAATEMRQKLDFERQQRERRLYNSRIGQALDATFRNLAGRGSTNRIGPGQSVDEVHDFASDRRVPLRARPSASREREGTTKVSIVQTTPSTINTHTSGDSTTCTPCEDNSTCQKGNYCYHSRTCTFRICQPL